MSDHFQEMPIGNFDGAGVPREDCCSQAFYDDAYSRPTVIIINPQRHGDLPQIYDAGANGGPIGYQEPGPYRHQQFQHPAPWEDMPPGGYDNFVAESGRPFRGDMPPQSELPMWFDKDTVERLLFDDDILDIAATASESVSYKDFMRTMYLVSMRLNTDASIDDKTLFEDVLAMAPMLGVSEQGITEMQRIVAEKIAPADGAGTAQFDGQPGQEQSFDPQTGEPIGPQTIEPQFVVPQTVEPQDVVPQSVEPQEVVPQTVEPQSVVPQTVEPQDVAPQNLGPQSSDTIFGAPADPEGARSAENSSGQTNIAPTGDPTVIPSGDPTVIPPADQTVPFEQQTSVPTDNQTIVPSDGQVIDPTAAQNDSGEPTATDQTQTQAQATSPVPAAGGTVMDQLMG